MNDATHLPPNQNLLPEVRKPKDIDLSSLDEALLQKVHSGNQRIHIEKEFGGNYGGARVFLVLPVNADGSRDARLVTKLGHASDLSREQKNYQQHVANALPFSAAHVRDYCEQDGQAALNYDFAGEGVLGETVTLLEYYGTHGSDEIAATLSSLLDKALGAWYRQSVPFNYTFREEYGERLPSHDEMLKAISVIFPDLTSSEKERIEIPGMDISYPNPLKTHLLLLDKILEGRASYAHGDLHLRNVLVDQDGKGWLIDFANVAKHHTMLDFIKLETYTRLMALALQHRKFSWDNYAQFEYALNANTLNQNAPRPNNPHLEKAYVVIQTIRQIARKYMGPEQDFQKEYFPALFLYCLARLKHYESNGLAPTQLIFITTCILGQFIFEEPKIMKPTSNEDKEKEKPKSKLPSQTGISIRGNANGSIIMTGNNNKVQQSTRKINTGGGTYIEGGVHTGGGDFVGRDKTDRSIKVGDISNSTGVAIGDGAQANVAQSSTSVDEIAKAFAIIMTEVNRERDSAKKERAEKLVQKLEAEAHKGEQADEVDVESWFTSLAKTSADAWEVAVATLSNPITGISKVFQKIAQRAKDDGRH